MGRQLFFSSNIIGEAVWLKLPITQSGRLVPSRRNPSYGRFDVLNNVLNNAARLWHWIAVFTQAFNVQSNGFSNQFLYFSSCFSGSNTAWKVGNVGAKTGAASFDDCRGFRHVRLNRACFRIAFSVPLGISTEGWPAARNSSQAAVDSSRSRAIRHWPVVVVALSEDRREC
jgi:hypothetical protein